MRRFRAIVSATARELLGEPFGLLVLLAALALAVFAPVLHYHQFGEPSRMARDAGFSAILVGTLVFAVTGAVRTFRREDESGTRAVVLAHSVSPARFFLAKTVGCAVATFVFALTLTATSATVVNGAVIGGRVAAPTGDIAKVWGPCVALATAVLVVPLVAAAALNRFARWRFVPTVHVLALILAVLSVAYRFDGALLLRWLPVQILFAVPAFVALAAASAFAARFRTPVATTLTVLAFLLFAPAVGNYCLSESLANGGALAPGYFFGALAAAVPAVGAFLALGAALGERQRD